MNWRTTYLVLRIIKNWNGKDVWEEDDEDDAWQCQNQVKFLDQADHGGAIASSSGAPQPESIALGVCVWRDWTRLEEGTAILCYFLDCFHVTGAQQVQHWFPEAFYLVAEPWTLLIWYGTCYRHRNVAIRWLVLVTVPPRFDYFHTLDEFTFFFFRRIYVQASSVVTKNASQKSSSNAHRFINWTLNVQP